MAKRRPCDNCGKVMEKLMPIEGEALCPDCVKETLKKTDFKKLLVREQILNQLEKPAPKFLPLSMGTHNGVFYYGGNFTDQDGKRQNLVVTSDRQVYGGKLIKEDFGLEHTADFNELLIDFPWEGQAIHKFLEGKNEKVTLKELFQELHEKINYFMDNHDSRINEYLTCTAIASYAYRLFPTFGRVLLTGETSSGKSKQTRLLYFTMFNTFWASSVSGAALYRSVEQTGGTACVDNLDNLSDDQKKDIYNLVETGWEEDGVYRRGDKNNMEKVHTYHTFAPMVVNSILGMHHVTENRCAHIGMLKTITEKGNRRPNKKEPFWDDWRNKARVYVLENWEDIVKAYAEVEKERPLKDREFEVSAPAVTIAKMVSPETYENVCSYIRGAFAKQKERDYSTDFTYWVLRNMLEKTEGSGTASITAEELGQLVLESHRGLEEPSALETSTKEAKEYRRELWKTKVSIGKTLGKVPGIEVRKSGNANTRYIYERQSILRLMMARNYCSEEERELWVKELTTPPTPTTPSPPSTLPTPEKGVGGGGGVGGGAESLNIETIDLSSEDTKKPGVQENG